MSSRIYRLTLLLVVLNKDVYLFLQALYAGTSEFPLDTRLSTIHFFVLQGLAVIVEQIFETRTGRQVGGTTGKAWLLLAMLVPGGNLARAWYVSLVIRG